MPRDLRADLAARDADLAGIRYNLLCFTPDDNPDTTTEALSLAAHECEAEVVRQAQQIRNLTADLARLRDVLAAERGERGPEGWEWTGAWTHPSHGIVRHEFVLESGTVRVGWYIVGVDGYPRPGSYASALDAMEAADRAAKEPR